MYYRLLNQSGLCLDIGSICMISLSYITLLTQCRYILHYRNKSKTESENICNHYCSLQKAKSKKIDQFNCWRTLGKSFKMNTEDSPNHNWLISTVQIYTLIRLFWTTCTQLYPGYFHVLVNLHDSLKSFSLS